MTLVQLNEVLKLAYKIVCNDYINGTFYEISTDQYYINVHHDTNSEFPSFDFNVMLVDEEEDKIISSTFIKMYNVLEERSLYSSLINGSNYIRVDNVMNQIHLRNSNELRKDFVGVQCLSYDVQEADIEGTEFQLMTLHSTGIAQALILESLFKNYTELYFLVQLDILQEIEDSMADDIIKELEEAINERVSEYTSTD